MQRSENYVVKMESFKLYLPSNVSTEHFPNNSSSNYQTYLHDPLQLEGEWHVAAESIYYAADIGDDEGEINLSVAALENIPINNLSTNRFKVGKKVL